MPSGPTASARASSESKHWLARREREEMPRERAGPFGQCSGSTGHDSIGVGLLMFQKNSALAQWFRARTENTRGTRKTMIVALARKLLIALWRLVREGVVPDGVVLRPAQ